MPQDGKVFIDHWVSQLWGVDGRLLDDQGFLMAKATQVAKDLNLTIVDSSIHKFEPFGLSLVLVISESHLAIHTWPEIGYMHVDALSCAVKADLAKLEGALKKEFNPEKITARKVKY